MTDKLDDAALAAIKARHATSEEYKSGFIPQAEELHADRAALLAEVARLRDENERLRTESAEFLSAAEAREAKLKEDLRWYTSPAQNGY